MNHLLFLSTLLLLLVSSLSLAEDNERLVVIDGALTEIVYRLGAEENLVATDSTSTFPKPATKLPNVGYLRALSTEGILSVKPSQIITTESAGPKPVLEQLEAAGIEVHVIQSSYSIKGVFEKIDAMAKILNKEKQAQTLKKELSAQVDTVEKLLKKQSTTPKVLIFLGMQGNQMMAAGKGTQAQAVLDILNAENVATTVQGYKPMNKEAVIASHADAIFILSHQTTSHGEALEQFIHTQAGKNNKVFIVNSSQLLGFGPRFPEALLEVAQKLYR